MPRSISTLIHRVQADLPLTAEEHQTLREWIDMRQKQNDRLINFMVGAVVILICIGAVLAIWGD